MRGLRGLRIILEFKHIIYDWLLRYFILPINSQHVKHCHPRVLDGLADTAAAITSDSPKLGILHLLHYYVVCVKIGCYLFNLKVADRYYPQADWLNYSHLFFGKPAINRPLLRNRLATVRSMPVS